MCSADIFLGVLAILFPPLPVWVKRGLCSADSLINILLCILGFVPGLLHAWYIIAKFPEPNYEYETVGQQDSEAGGRVTYVIVHPDGRRQHHHQQQPPKAQGNMTYGTTGNNAAPSNTNNDDAGEGGSNGGAPPPSYAQVVSGDHKVQTQE